jgi:hypothetical protein
MDEMLLLSQLSVSLGIFGRRDREWIDDLVPALEWERTACLRSASPAAESLNDPGACPLAYLIVLRAAASRPSSLALAARGAKVYYIYLGTIPEQDGKQDGS